MKILFMPRHKKLIYMKKLLTRNMQSEKPTEIVTYGMKLYNLLVKSMRIKEISSKMDV